MRQKKTAAVILDSTPVFDSDRSYLLFTRELGKIRARAKGVRKISSRLSGHLLLYIPTQLEMIESSSGWHLIIQAQIISDREKTLYPEDVLQFQSIASILAEGIDKLFIEGDPHAEVYDGLAYTFELLRLNDAKLRFLIVAEFFLKALRELGYLPELYKSALTGESLEENDLAWSSEVGGLIEGKNRSQAYDSFMINNSRSVVTLRKMLDSEFVSKRLKINIEVEKEVAKIVFHYLQTVIGKPIKSMGVLL